MCSLHAECGLFVQNKTTGTMESTCKNCIRVCVGCKEYVVHHTTSYYPRECQRFYSPFEIEPDYGVERKATDNFYVNAVSCTACFFKNCASCEKLVPLTKIAYCEGCKLKICDDCGKFQEAQNVSYYSSWKKAHLFCRKCIENTSCTLCNKRGNPIGFARCFKCSTWNCLNVSTSCTIRTTMEGPGIENINKYLCKKCSIDESVVVKRKRENS
jgi:hypothetical protein